MPPPALEPQSSVDLAAMLRQAAAERLIVVPWGMGTRQHIGYAPPQHALTLHTTALNRVIEHVAADMTVTVEAGITLGALQATLASQNQWLPWNPPCAAEATVGGLLATAASGPLRLGYGTPRDWVLGMQVVLGDGRLVKSGGKVVKNVAGYDLHKLHIGALGTLGVITQVTFKVFPLPEHEHTLLFTCPARASALQLAAALHERPYAPVSVVLLNRVAVRDLLDTSIEIGTGGFLLAVRWAGVAAAVERQAQAARGAAEAGTTIAEPDATQARDFWQQVGDFTAHAPERFTLRTARAPAHLEALLAALDAHIPLTGQATGVLAYPGVGLCQARLTLPPQINAALATETLAALRAALPTGGYAVVEDAPGTLRAALDLWGPMPNAALMAALRRQWDPAAVLNRERYVRGV